MSGEEVFLQGHIPEGARVTLLADPFSRIFRPQYCTGIAGSYRPAASDPAVLGNVTEVGHLKDCDRTAPYTLAVLERTITQYKALPFHPLPDSIRSSVLSHPIVQASFKEFGYDPADFDIANAQSSKAAGEHGEILFLSALKPIRYPPNAFPCADPALLLSVGSRDRVQAVLPFCAVTWNLFQLNEELYLSATTQAPTPPKAEAMNPDWTPWLFRVEESALSKIWPAKI
jgi:hypothetical protein